MHIRSSKQFALRLTSLALVLTLGACASDTTKRMGDAAVTPLNDLNVVRADIPDVLEQAQKAPYVMPRDATCIVLSVEIRKLDEVLGADLDAPVSDTRPSLMERASTLANEQAINAVQRTAQDLIPFRGWVRKLSGAERYSKKVAAAIAAGSVRRAFLKGVAASQVCQWQNLPVEAVKSGGVPEVAAATAPATKE
ncbi:MULTISPECIES: hypothetical protein [unclassified Massilia]|uniref:hypothetical protein n=1 Tax=unclassified Massilia TaxID=2609279 RepID=UPI00160085CC|nr:MULTISPECIES: hypothetical protein [unclassified Massilia]